MYPFAMHISLIVPAPFEQVSGGYGYDRRMVAELRARRRDGRVWWNSQGAFRWPTTPRAKRLVPRGTRSARQRGR